MTSRGAGAERWAGVVENYWAGAESGAESRGAGAERGAGVTKIGLSGERVFYRSRSAHMLCIDHSRAFFQLYSPDGASPSIVTGIDIFRAIYIITNKTNNFKINP